MTRKLIFTFALVLFVNALFAQVRLPTIKATSKKVDVRDAKRKTVDIIPFDRTGQTQQKKEETEIGTGMKFTYYKTNNPTIFWNKPE